MRTALLLLAAASLASSQVFLESPSDFQVFQRTTPTTGSILVRGSVANPSASVEARVNNGPWLPLRVAGGRFTGEIPSRAGGFFAVDVRSSTGTTTVSHVGVGEVFIIAGQSNSTNYGESRRQTRTRMISTFDGTSWRIADDPQPGVQDSSTKGSFIPAFGDALYEKLHVPVAVACVGAGSTSVRQWLPAHHTFATQPTMTKFVTATPDGKWQSTGQLFEGLLLRIRQFPPNGFRAILWHQGESDANQKEGHTVTGAEYVMMLKDLILATRHQAAWDIPWFIAQATYHSPDDVSSPNIRAAQARIAEEGFAFEGPDTDRLGREYREKNGTGVHFNEQGLEAHGKLWADKVAEWLNP